MAAAGLPALRSRISVAAPVTLSLWSGSGGNIAPFYKMAADEYPKTHPGFALEVDGALPPREFEQKRHGMGGYGRPHVLQHKLTDPAVLARADEVIQ